VLFHGLVALPNDESEAQWQFDSRAYVIAKRKPRPERHDASNTSSGRDYAGTSQMH